MYLLSKDVISFLFFPIYITMDTSILIAWKKKERECDDKVKELHCKYSQLKKVQNNLFYFTDLAHFSIHLELKLNITYSVSV